jgi:hypothetical protein
MMLCKLSKRVLICLFGVWAAHLAACAPRGHSISQSVMLNPVRVLDGAVVQNTTSTASHRSLDFDLMPLQKEGVSEHTSTVVNGSRMWYWALVFEDTNAQTVGYAQLLTFFNAVTFTDDVHMSCVLRTDEEISLPVRRTVHPPDFACGDFACFARRLMDREHKQTNWSMVLLLPYNQDQLVAAYIDLERGKRLAGTIADCAISTPACIHGID